MENSSNFIESITEEIRIFTFFNVAYLDELTDWLREDGNEYTKEVRQLVEQRVSRHGMTLNYDRFMGELENETDKYLRFYYTDEIAVYVAGCCVENEDCEDCGDYVCNYISDGIIEFLSDKNRRRYFVEDVVQEIAGNIIFGEHEEAA